MTCQYPGASESDAIRAANVDCGASAVLTGVAGACSNSPSTAAEKRGQSPIFKNRKKGTVPILDRIGAP